MNRMALRAGVVAMAVGAAGCNCGAKPCGGCGPAQACDAATQKCGPALAYGDACQDDAGAPLPLPCEDGTSCQTAVSPPVCAAVCDPAAVPTTCQAPQQCWQLLDDAGAAVIIDGGSGLGYCAGISSSGQRCGTEGLSFCDPSLACVFFSAGSADGVCFAPCDPTGAASCAVPDECLAVFSDATLGICAVPQAQDAGCVQAEGLFCPQGQLCLDPGDGGACYTRCTPGTGAGCAAPQSCLAPTGDPTVGICAQAVPPGGSCDPTASEFCDNQSYCILGADGGASCHTSCDPAAPVCPAGESCLGIQGSSLAACG